MHTERMTISVLFLHGYRGTLPAAQVAAAFERAGLAARVEAPIAPSGADRVDEFNPVGLPSWFRYLTDDWEIVPQPEDTINHLDADACLHEPVLNGPSGAESLWEAMDRLVAESGPTSVMLAGESQGGIMAALAAMEWNRRNPTAHLGHLGLVRTAPIRDTWRPRPPRWWTDPPSRWTTSPLRQHSLISIVLAERDQQFTPEHSIAALGPLLRANPLRFPELGTLFHSPDGNSDLRIVMGADHSSHQDRVLATLAESAAALRRSRGL